MFAAASFILFMALDGAAAPQKKDVDTHPPALAKVLEQARHDFEAKYKELGLLGAAPLVGREAPASDACEIASVHADFDGAAQAQPQAAVALKP